MNYTDVPALDILVAGGVATVAIDDPPLNLLDGVLLLSLRRSSTLSAPTRMSGS